VAQPGSARRSGRRGPRFKSGRPDVKGLMQTRPKRLRFPGGTGALFVLGAYQDGFGDQGHRAGVPFEGSGQGAYFTKRGGQPDVCHALFVDPKSLEVALVHQTSEVVRWGNARDRTFRTSRSEARSTLSAASASSFFPAARQRRLVVRHHAIRPVLPSGTPRGTRPGTARAAGCRSAAVATSWALTAVCSRRWQRAPTRSNATTPGASSGLLSGALDGGDDVVGRQRPGEEVALGLVTAEGSHTAELFVGFDAFSD
jgi:hypothetical protein